MNQTLHYYNENAAAFIEGTVNTDMSHLYGGFLGHVSEGGRILDLGCGSGRDSREFLAPGGVLYFSFKRGTGERMVGERFFNDYTEDTVKNLFAPENGWEILGLFVTGDVREGREGEQWVNGVVKTIF